MNPKVKSTASPEAKSSHCSVPQFPPSVSWRGNSCPVCCPELWGKVKRCGGPTDTSKEHQRAVCSSMKEVRMRPVCQLPQRPCPSVLEFKAALALSNS